MNRENEVNIEDLRLELNRLRIAADNIERLITAAQEDRPRPEEEPKAPVDRRPLHYQYTHPVVRDREGVKIIIRDQVQFITRGLFTSSVGTVYKISDNGSRVTARDHLYRSISRAPRNVRVVLHNNE